MSFSERLKKLRMKAGLTQEKLASLLDIPESTIRRLESSSEGSLPRRERLEKIADFFGVSVDYLLGREESVEETLGDKIKNLRRENKWTQQELATKVNVSSQVISNWERGYTDPNHNDIARLAKALDTSADYLLGRTDDPKPTPEKDINIEDPEIGLWFRQLSDEAKEEAKRFLKFLLEEEKNRKPGDKQGE